MIADSHSSVSHHSSILLPPLLPGELVGQVSFIIPSLTMLSHPPQPRLCHGHHFFDPHRNRWKGPSLGSTGVHNLQTNSHWAENCRCPVRRDQHLRQLLPQQGAYPSTEIREPERLKTLFWLLFAASLPQLPPQTPHREPQKVGPLPPPSTLEDPLSCHSWYGSPQNRARCRRLGTPQVV